MSAKGKSEVLIGVGGDFFCVPMDVLDSYKLDEAAVKRLDEEIALDDEQLDQVSGGVTLSSRLTTFQQLPTKMATGDLVAGVRG